MGLVPSKFVHVYCGYGCKHVYIDNGIQIILHDVQIVIVILFVVYGKMNGLFHEKRHNKRLCLAFMLVCVKNCSSSNHVISSES